MHVIFDLDGTLTDSKPGIVGCIHHALAELEIELDASINLEQHIGPPLREVFVRICGNRVDPNLAVEVYRERYAATGLFENSVYDGIEACLETLLSRADSIYIATSKPTVYSERIIEHFGIGDFFKVIYGAHLDGSLGKKSELLAHLLERESLDPGACVMIGDRHYDMVGARANGIRAIGVLWGYGSEEELLTAGASRLCRHPAEICAQIFSR